jgi:hypothetical protein
MHIRLQIERLVRQAIPRDRWLQCISCALVGLLSKLEVTRRHARVQFPIWEYGSLGTSKWGTLATLLFTPVSSTPVPQLCAY